MKIGISNIAWDFAHDPEYLSLLNKSNLNIFEIAPTKIWPDISKATKEACILYRKNVNSYGLEIDSMQSALFGTTNLDIFTSPDDTLDYLKGILRICGWLEVTKMVFGSPKNRIAPETWTKTDVQTKAKDFFVKLATIASEFGVYICLEPNAKEYGCNFLTKTEEVVSFVQEINHTHLHTHIDTGVLIINCEDIFSAIYTASKTLKHVHISAPYLAKITSYDTIFKKLKEALESINYSGNIVIEMKQTSEIYDDNYANIEKSLNLIKEIFT